MTSTIIFVIAVAYFAGSINFAILVMRIFAKKDPRKFSSGNPGTFNVYRNFGIRWALPVFLLDIGRAAGIAFLAIGLLPKSAVPFVALSLILGNHFPVFHGFSGGKGVANYVGFTAVITPLWTLAGLASWVLVYKIGREAFIGSFFMVAVLGIGQMAFAGFHAAPCILTSLTVALIIYFHKENILGFIENKKSSQK